MVHLPGDRSDWERKRLKYRDARVAGEYDRLRYQGPIKRLRESLHVRALERGLGGLAPGSRVLDLPCGTGHHTAWLVGRGYRVVAADIAPAMLARAGARPGGAAAARLVAEAERLPFPDGAFDAALVARFIHLLPDAVRARVLGELARVTRQRVVISLSCNPYAAKHLLRRLRGRTKGTLLTRAELEDELERAGLRLVRLVTKLPFVSTLWVAVCAPQPAGHS